jgi:hypothetical protein
MSFNPGFFHDGSPCGPGGTSRATTLPCLSMPTSSPFSTKSKYDEAFLRNSLDDTVFIHNNVHGCTFLYNML